AFFNRAYQFLFDFYDIREEFEKDIWDVRNIPNVRYSRGSTNKTRISYAKQNFIKKKPISCTLRDNRLLTTKLS
ncbi:hypothetical protein, partial [Bacillus cereus group sp. BfR-BA-01353]|uniref:hypothetical protein n=1 Tax=Bacillus cereus group sp. BfR-BA-01353 TaxID=2920316 RepID=UPI001F57A613